MKKSIFIFVALIFSITSLFSKNIYAKVVDIDMSKYELVDDITLSWEIIGEGYSGPLFESNLFEVKRNQIYLFPMANTTTNLYEDIRLKFYDSNNDLVEEMYASTTYDDDDLKWGRIVNPDDVISVIYLTVPENANFLKMEASAFGQESDEEFTKLIHDFIKVYKYKTDEIPPVIQGQGVYITNVEHPILLDDVKKSLEAIDNVDGDISKSLIIKEENYTGNEAKIGTYEVLFECKDKSNNIAQYKVTIKVYDVTDPTLESREYNVISSMSEAEKTIEQIKALLSANDNIDGNLTDKIEIIEDNYSGNEDKVGRYKMTFKVSDNAGNFTTCDVYINVNDNIPPLILVEGTIIPVSVFETLTFKDIKAILLAYLEEQNLAVESIYEVSNDYENNKNKEGRYNVKLAYRLTSGKTEEVDLDILVYNPSTLAKTSSKPNYLAYYIIGGTVVVCLTISLLIIKRRQKNSKMN